ncbi:hypothetical protein ONR57_04110 [Hoyosella sp. YIM 151337]|uniref:hypothetical protein n=1 Tax=Hoyosella sp. YIM 151337 TaxID=2992742 RepID=UPI002235CA76|nr:hypothetical protein [Hoyosella sp. YIM 151337]MCW4352484.1 hypothetical protein [Hoyosella sp. YIM 151337]
MRTVMSRVAAWLAGLLAVVLLVQREWTPNGLMADRWFALPHQSLYVAGVLALLSGVAAAHLLSGVDLWVRAATVTGSAIALMLAQVLLSPGVIFGGILVGVFLAAVLSARPGDAGHSVAVIAGVVTGYVAMAVAHLDLATPRRYADYIVQSEPVLGLLGALGLVTLIVAALARRTPGDRRIVVGAVILAATGLLLVAIPLPGNTAVSIARVAIAAVVTALVALWLGGRGGIFLIVCMVVAGAAFPVLQSGLNVEVAGAAVVAVCVLVGVVAGLRLAHPLASIAAPLLVAAAALLGAQFQQIYFLFAIAAAAGYAITAAFPRGKNLTMYAILGVGSLFAGPVAAVSYAQMAVEFGWTAYAPPGTPYLSHVQFSYFGASQPVVVAVVCVVAASSIATTWWLTRRLVLDS